MESAIREILNLAVRAFSMNDPDIATRVEPLEEVIDQLKDDILSRHVERLQRGECTIELGFILTNLLTNYERISDHCSNIAASIIKTDSSALALDIHGYLNEVRSGTQNAFTARFEEYEKKYSLDAGTF